MQKQKSEQIEAGNIVQCPFIHEHRMEGGRVVRRVYRAGTFPAAVVSVGSKWIRVFRATNSKRYRFLKNEVRLWKGKVS